MQDRSTRFFGTDFSFEDLEERDVNQFDYKLLGDDVIDGAAAWKILSIPKRSKISQYTSSIVWIRKDTYAFARIESYVDDKAVKRLEYSSFQNIQGVWTARETKMIDLRRGSLTRLAVDKMEYNLPLDEERFTLEALRRQ
jgi:hypothetical protein